MLVCSLAEDVCRAQTPSNQCVVFVSHIFGCSLTVTFIILQAMAVAGMTSDGRHRSIDHPKVLRTPPGSPGRVRASYHTPGMIISLPAEHCWH